MSSFNTIKIVFQIDITSSMGKHLQICKENIKNMYIQFMKKITNKSNIEFAIVGYRDFSDDSMFELFDFSDDIPSVNLDFIYVDVNDEGFGSNFPYAEIAEKRVDNNNSSWMYLKFEDGVGRHNFGFYDSINLPDSPSVSFSPSIVDFPDNLTYQSYFSDYTSFNASLGSYDLDIEYTLRGLLMVMETVFCQIT